jgi:pimeloyl-ACP methyl ester carboxylesterase
MKEKIILYQNTNLHYKITGSGLPVLLIHGFAEDSSIWDNQVEFLKNDYNLIIPDLPGSGKSGIINSPLSFGEGSGVRSTEDICIDDYAQCIHQILTKEKIAHCIMIGHSMGGYITLAFAEKYPEFLIAFGLFHSSAYADDDIKVETRKKAIEFIEKNGPGAFLKTSIPGLFFDQGNSKQPDALIEKGKAFPATALIQYYKAMIARYDRTNILINTSVPVLLIVGEHDKAVPFKHSLEQSHMPGQSYLHILRNSAHMGMLEEPEKVNQILANFLLYQNSNNKSQTA